MEHNTCFLPGAMVTSGSLAAGSSWQILKEPHFLIVPNMAFHLSEDLSKYAIYSTPLKSIKQLNNMKILIQYGT